MRLLDITPTSAMEAFQSAYYNQIGRRMTIGSEEYTLSSIFSYVMAAHAAMMNVSNSNRFLETASGMFLDNIASAYGLHRDGESLTKSYIEGILNLGPYVRHYAKGEFKFQFAGYTFANVREFTYYASVPTAMRFETDEDVTAMYSRSEVMDALVGEGKPFEEGTELSGVAGYRDPMDDEAFREYISRNKRLYAAGSAGAFEAAAIVSQQAAIDAHVLRQSERGFEAGMVKLLIRVDPLFDAMVTPVITPSIHAVVEQLNLLTIGQTLTVSTATAYRVEPHVGRLYVSKSFSQTEAEALVTLKLAALVYSLNRTLRIGEPFYASNLVEAMKTPLPTVSDPLSVYGITQEDYERVKDFTVLGGGDHMSAVQQPGPTSYVELGTAIFTLTLI